MAESFNIKYGAEAWVHEKYGTGGVMPSEGVRVLFKDLKSTPKYNGTEGVITGFNDRFKRWTVKADLDGMAFAALDKNLDT